MSRLPFVSRMAALAIRAVVTVMAVVFQVTAHTCRVHFIGEGICAVTIIAAQPGVMPG